MDEDHTVTECNRELVMVSGMYFVVRLMTNYTLFLNKLVIFGSSH